MHQPAVVVAAVETLESRRLLSAPATIAGGTVFLEFDQTSSDTGPQPGETGRLVFGESTYQRFEFNTLEEQGSYLSSRPDDDTIRVTLNSDDPDDLITGSFVFADDDSGRFLFVDTDSDFFEGEFTFSPGTGGGGGGGSGGSGGGDSTEAGPAPTTLEGQRLRLVLSSASGGFADDGPGIGQPFEVEFGADTLEFFFGGDSDGTDPYTSRRLDGDTFLVTFDDGTVTNLEFNYTSPAGGSFGASEDGGSGNGTFTVVGGDTGGGGGGGGGGSDPLDGGDSDETGLAPGSVRSGQLTLRFTGGTGEFATEPGPGGEVLAEFGRTGYVLSGGDGGETGDYQARRLDGNTYLIGFLEDGDDPDDRALVQLDFTSPGFGRFGISDDSGTGNGTFTLATPGEGPILLSPFGGEMIFRDGVLQLEAGAGDDFIGISNRKGALFVTRNGVTGIVDPSEVTSVSINAGQGDNYVEIAAAGLASVIGSGDGRDTIIGNSARDYVESGGGSDQIFGQGGNDLLLGLAGDDVIYGGPGDDTLYGFGDNDILEGDAGRDRLFGGDGNDTLAGGSGRDFLYAEGGDDILIGGPDRDLFNGGAGTDTAFVGPEDDTTNPGLFAEIETIQS